MNRAMYPIIPPISPSEEEPHFDFAAMRNSGTDASDQNSLTMGFSFLQNLCKIVRPKEAQAYRQHLSSDTLVVPRLVLPYLNKFHTDH